MSSPEQVKNIFGMLYNVVVVITCFNIFSDLNFFYIGIKSLMLKFREDSVSVGRSLISPFFTIAKN